HPSAQNKLGLSYFLGIGVPQDYISSHVWLNISSANGNKDAADSRDRVARYLTEPDISEAQRRASVCISSGYQNCD
ncbi:MAG: hypothetical protein Q8S27_01180, partial [Hoeflea sp.]|nr:hypothetical protein [Hoeflea sp.]